MVFFLMVLLVSPGFLAFDDSLILFGLDNSLVSDLLRERYSQSAFFHDPFRVSLVQDSSAEEDLEEQKVEAVVIEVGPETYFVEVHERGFTPRELVVERGGIVEWENILTSRRIKKVMIIGNCDKFKSDYLTIGESYSWRFLQTGKCVVVDAVSKHAMKIVVE